LRLLKNSFISLLPFPAGKASSEIPVVQEPELAEANRAWKIPPAKFLHLAVGTSGLCMLKM
jgi:hypothetical protein